MNRLRESANKPVLRSKNRRTGAELGIIEKTNEIERVFAKFFLDLHLSTMLLCTF